MADTDGRDRASATKFVAPFTYMISVVNQSVQFYCAIYRVSHLEDLCTWFLAKFNEIFAVFSENVCTPVQITFLTKPTGIYLLMTYNRHIPSHTSKKNPLILKNYPLFASKSAGLRECFIVEVTNIVRARTKHQSWSGEMACWQAGKIPSPNSDHYHLICRLVDSKWITSLTLSLLHFLFIISLDIILCTQSEKNWKLRP